MTTLGDALPEQMARVRDEVLPVYDGLGREGSFAARMMRADLDAAARAMVSGDLVEMIRCHESLKGWKL